MKSDYLVGCSVFRMPMKTGASGSRTVGILRAGCGKFLVGYAVFVPSRLCWNTIGSSTRTVKKTTRLISWHDSRILTLSDADRQAFYGRRGSGWRRRRDGFGLLVLLLLRDLRFGLGLLRELDRFRLLRGSLFRQLRLQEREHISHKSVVFAPTWSSCCCGSCTGSGSGTCSGAGCGAG